MKSTYIAAASTRLATRAIAIIFAFFGAVHSFAQTGGAHPLSKQQSWQLMDFQQDTVYGTSVNRAYKELLKGKVSRPVIVAVIDEGVDISHPDLKGHIWTNPKEVAGNGVDDDKNGYIDDVHGWNFLGGKDGKNMYATSSEADREYARLWPAFAGKDSLQQTQQKDYAYFLSVKKEHIKDSVGRNLNVIAIISHTVGQVVLLDSLVHQATHKPVVYYDDINSFQPADSTQTALKKYVLSFFTRNNEWQKISLDSIVKSGMEAVGRAKTNQQLYAQVKSDPLQARKEIIGDNPFDISDKNYGNNIVGDEYADHGTHCSCIIAADRMDGIGIEGIADNVIILPVRAVNTLHFGDEMDKDISLAIRYAVDNGARIISMSFGKDLSPNKPWVDDAIRYAETKGVLLVHAAGNDGQDIDTTGNFPNPYSNTGAKANNFINVGSISKDTGSALPAKDSNYGQDKVDLFAPGVSIYSCLPGNKYGPMSGTSMATPAVAGVAALLLEYYPHLTAVQLKDILMKSVTSLKGKMVYRPGSKEKVDFGTLCVSGGVVNAYNALQLAEKMESGTK